MRKVDYNYILGCCSYIAGNNTNIEEIKTRFDIKDINILILILINTHGVECARKFVNNSNVSTNSE